LADALEQFLAHCADYGAARHTLLCLASELLLVAGANLVNMKAQSVLVG
jgi:hypothetical protein